jgi:hypothetical protein
MYLIYSIYQLFLPVVGYRTYDTFFFLLLAVSYMILLTIEGGQPSR